VQQTQRPHHTITHIFTPIAVETAGSWNQQAVDVIEDIGSRISMAVAIQRANAVSSMSTFDNDHVNFNLIL